ncbi:MAG TPA: acyl-CoA dehydrogenase [Ramlibacter sp.]|nr:acyl-CoA dehydrogenase [Ramlibacter sp.]
MDFSFTEEQTMFRDGLERFLRDRYSFETRRASVASASGWRPELWRALGEEMGLLGVALPEECGGLGGGAVEVMIAMETLGRSLVVEPFLPTVVMAGGLLQRASSPLAAEALAAIVRGAAVIAVGLYEPQGRFDAAATATTARRDGTGYRLAGTKALVFGAPWADRLIVSARSSGAPGDRQGLSLFLLDKNAPGVRSVDYATIDGQRASDIHLDDVRVEADALLCAEGEAMPLIEQVLDEACAAVCAEGVGVMREMLAATVAYAQERRQFGQPIANFQVLQHRMADMLVALEQSVSLTYLATLSLSAPAAERSLAVSAAKVQVANACRQLGQGAIQIHGGMGQTDEVAVTSYFKRATVIESQFGSADYHLDRFQRLALDAGVH